MPKHLVGYNDPFTDALFEHGLVKERPEDVRRIVIDLEVGSVARIYVEKFADTDVLAPLLHAGIKWETRG